MKKLVILGNGYDLACGFKTSFSDIYKFYREKIEFPDGFAHDCNFIFFLLYETFFTEDVVRESFQKVLNIDSCENWMDVELLLNHFILGNAFELAKNMFGSSCLTDRVDEVSGAFRDYFYKRKPSIGRNNSFEYFVNKELYDFEIMLRDYIKKEEWRETQFALNKDYLFKKITRGSECSVMTFNYTAPLLNDGGMLVNYVHGSVRTEAIVGIDILDLDAIHSYQRKNGIVSDKTTFTKTRKKLAHVAIDEKNINLFEKSVNRIVFYGHSLGEQDYSYFQSLFDFYDIYSSDMILEFCYSEYKANSNAYEVDKQTTRVFNLINKYGSTLNNKDHGKNLLHKMLLENRIVFRKIDL